MDKFSSVPATCWAEDAIARQAHICNCSKRLDYILKITKFTEYQYYLIICCQTIYCCVGAAVGAVEEAAGVTVVGGAGISTGSPCAGI